MATETLAPNSLDVQTNLTGSLTDIDEDPDSADGNWLTAANNVTTTCRVSFPTPTGDPRTGSGLQEFRVRVRETATNNGKTDDAVSVYLYENGSQVGSVLATTSNIAGDPGQVISATWDASSLGTSDGSLVECHVVGTPEGGGPPGGRGSIEVGAIEWNVDYVVPGSGPAAGLRTLALTGSGI